MEVLETAARPRLLIGVPTYRGTAFIAETLDAIQAQQFADFDVLISVDNNDAETALACEPYLSDPRFRVVVQKQHLNWNGNINWLMSQEGYELFCYWQHDDVATADYLRALVGFLDDNPDFVCAFGDIEWMEDRVSWTCPTITGFALTRAMHIIETLNVAPFRGVIRKTAIDRAGLIRKTAHESAWEDVVWLARLAREGNLGRVEGPLYLKRRHSASVSSPWMEREVSWKRAAWMEIGLGMLETILPAINMAERETALAVVLERLCCARDGRFRLYETSSDSAFVSEFLQEARERYGIHPPDGRQEARDADLLRGIFRFWRNRDAATELSFAELHAAFREHGKAELHFHARSSAVRLLSSGWSQPESWGTWSDGPSAEIRLALPSCDRGLRVAVTCVAYATLERLQNVRVEAGGIVDTWRFDNNHGVEKQLLLPPGSSLNTVSFRFPDAVSPRALGESGDGRVLALGLIKLSIEQLDATETA